MRYFLSLGSNLGHKYHNLVQALSLLKKEKIKILKNSSIYETQPVDYLQQPKFYNQVVEVETVLKPLDLLELIKKIEGKMGRKDNVPKGPRIIDIDILLAEDFVLSSDRLTIPHPRLSQRNFVLIPLAEISPESCHPVLKKTIKELLDSSKDTAQVTKINNL